MTGILYGVGVGPGDPELMTLKAVKTIKECDIMGIPAKDRESCTAWKIACQAVPEIREKEVIAAPVPMTADVSVLEAAYEEGSRRLAEKLRSGRSIAFLNLGDPTLYGTYMEFHKRITGEGLGAEIISGVPSFCAVAARLGIALGERKEPIHILPGYYGTEDLDTLQGTKVIMKSAHKIEDVAEKLLLLEQEGGQKAYAVTNCGMQEEQVYYDLSEMEGNPGYFTTFIVKEANR